MNTRRIVVRRLWFAKSARVLASFGPYQTIQSVKDVVPVRPDRLILEIDRLSRRVPGRGDIADRVIYIDQIPQPDIVTASRCVETNETESQQDRTLFAVWVPLPYSISRRWPEALSSIFFTNVLELGAPFRLTSSRSSRSATLYVGRIMLASGAVSVTGRLSASYDVSLEKISSRSAGVVDQSTSLRTSARIARSAQEVSLKIV